MAPEKVVKMMRGDTAGLVEHAEHVLLVGPGEGFGVVLRPRDGGWPARSAG
jgi:hypothetical protein